MSITLFDIVKIVLKFIINNLRHKYHFINVWLSLTLLVNLKYKEMISYIKIVSYLNYHNDTNL